MRVCAVFFFCPLVPAVKQLLSASRQPSLRVFFFCRSIYSGAAANRHATTLAGSHASGPLQCHRSRSRGRAPAGVRCDPAVPARLTCIAALALALRRCHHSAHANRPSGFHKKTFSGKHRLPTISFLSVCPSPVVLHLLVQHRRFVPRFTSFYSLFNFSLFP